MSSALEDWLEGGLEWFVSTLGVVEDFVAERLVAPLRDELQGLQHDVRDQIDEWEAQRQLPGPPSGQLSLQRVRDVLSSSQRNAQLAELDHEGAAPLSQEEAASQKQLIIGLGTVAATLLAAVVHPALYLVSVAGLLYQARHAIGAAYHGLVHERRMNIYCQNVILVAGAMIVGSFTAITLGLCAGSLLRWFMAKTESKAHRSVAAVFSYQPRSVWMVSGEIEIEVDFTTVRVGDVIVIRAGSMIPVDGTVVRGIGAVDQRMLTGESRPAEKGPGDEVRASGVVLTGALYVRVDSSGNATVAAQIARMLTDTSSYKQKIWTRTEQRLERLLPPFLALGALTIPLRGLDTALAILWTIPGYRLIFFGPLTMLNFMHLTSSQGILLKDGQALERLRAVDTVVFDKTGTLTLEQPHLGRIFAFAGQSEAEVLALAAAAESGQTHPIARAIQHQARHLDIPVAEAAEVAVGLGMHVTVHGQRVRIGSERLMTLQGITLSDEARQHQETVHASGNSLVFIARETELLGAVEICPSLRSEAQALVADLQRRGKHVLILSGDHEAPTRALAAQLGIERYFAQVLPEEKAKVIEKLKHEGRTVCFVGDGINDAVALQRADVSISMKGATSIATDVAQVIFMSGNLGQMSNLLNMADEFERYMRTNRLATSLPAFFLVAGTLTFGWSYLTAVLLTQVTTPIILYNLLHAMGRELPPATAPDYSSSFEAPP